MPKYDAFGTSLTIGARQVETATVVGTITGDGNARCITTATGMTGSAITTDVAVLTNDTADTVATKIRAGLALVANIVAFWDIGGSGPYVTLTKKTAAANIADANLDINNESCTGLTDAPTSADTVAGIAPVAIASVQNFGGPGLAMDTEDVTTHDSTGAFEEVVGTILRTGELTVDIVYDPVADTHDATATTGLAYALANKLRRQFTLTFPDAGTTEWTFDGYCTGYEPSEPHDGALTATVTLKIDGVPTLA